MKESKVTFFGRSCKVQSSTAESICHQASTVAKVLPNAKLKIAIIGAGASGIAAAKSTAIDEGLDCEVFESAETPGGVWRPSGLAWEDMSVNISRFTCVFSDFSWEQAFPDHSISPYPKTPQMYAYLLAYIKHFRLQPYIHTGRTVLHISWNDQEQIWTITWREQGKIKKDNYATVLLATGRYQVPYVPNFKGMSSFAGKWLHSANYRAAKDFVGQSVLIVGGSLSGVAIASEISSCQHLIRKPRWIMPTHVKLAHGGEIPLDLSYSRAYKPIKDFNWFMKHCSTQNTIPEWKMTPDIPPSTAISDVYVKKVQEGAIKVIKDEIDYFIPSGVILKSGRTLSTDIIIFCTGYQYDFSFFDERLKPLLFMPLQLYEDTFHPDIPGLAFIGINYQARGAIFPLAELQARWACAIVSRRLKLPSREQMKEEIIKMPAHSEATFANALAAKLGIDNFESFAQQDPALYKILKEGSIVPAQYRVTGFGCNLDAAKTDLLRTQKVRQSYLNYKPRVFNAHKKDKSDKQDNPTHYPLTSRL